MPSLYGFDGRAVKVKGRVALVLALDGIAKYHPNKQWSLESFFHHELFHIYHRQVKAEFNTDTTSNSLLPIYNRLWSEGLAVYVSKVLNPNATLGEVLIDDNLAQKVPPLLSDLIIELRPKPNSTANSDHSYFFGFKRKDVPRNGYYIGMIAAKRLNKKYWLKQLSRLNGKKLEVQIVKVLDKISREKVKNG